MLTCGTVTLIIYAQHKFSAKKTGGLYNSKFRTQESDVLTVTEQETKYYLMNTFNAYGLVLVEEPQPICEEEKHFVLVNDTLKATTWSTDSQIEAYQSGKAQSVNPNSFLTRLGSGFTLANALSPNTIPNPAQRRADEENFNIDRLNPSTPNSIFNSNIADISNVRLLEEMPLQLKSIVAAAIGSNIVKYDVSRLPANPTSENAFVFNYLLLQGVEYLSGYEAASNGDKVLIKQPIWKIATFDQLDPLLENSEVLCRLRRFEHSSIPAIKLGEGLDLSSYDDYFILTQ